MNDLCIDLIMVVQGNGVNHSFVLITACEVDETDEEIPLTDRLWLLYTPDQFVTFLEMYGDRLVDGDREEVQGAHSAFEKENWNPRIPMYSLEGPHAHSLVPLLIEKVHVGCQDDENLEEGDEEEGPFTN